MGKPALTLKEINRIIFLRKRGHSLSEISEITSHGKATVSKYIKNIVVLDQYKDILKFKQGGSKSRSITCWNNAKQDALLYFPNISIKEKMLILACLYWGEGNKTEFNLINSDPALIKVVLDCLRDLDVKKDEIKISIRLFEEIDEAKALNFWSKITNKNKSQIRVNIIKGNKVGKLKFGMCRVRIQKGAKYFKLIMSMVDLIKLEFKAAVV